MEVKPMSDERLAELRYWPDYLWREEYTEELYDEIVRLKSTCEKNAQVGRVTHGVPIKWMGTVRGWEHYGRLESDTKVWSKCGRRVRPETATSEPTCKQCIKQLKPARSRNVYVPDANGFAFQEHIDMATSMES